jgi:UDP-3-O-[3-hydroxymyristoyl] N-acetylglucosamine deacetylase
VRIVSYRPQRTLRRPTEVTGTGFVTGARVRLRFVPAPPCSGVVFVRTDLTPPAVIAAHVDEVTGTARRTTLGRPPASVGLVEHVLAALAGLRIDNCRVELNAPEPPGLDGSAAGFVEALLDAGITVQRYHRAIWAVDEPVTVAHPGATLTLHPADSEGLRVSYLLDYGPFAQPPRQSHTVTITPGEFASRLAHSRTFLTRPEAEALREQGLGKRTTTADLIVFDADGPIDNVLRHADEPARHKVLDVVGDLALLGADLTGHVVAYRSGHDLNVELARTLRARMPARTQPARAA